MLKLLGQHGREGTLSKGVAKGAECMCKIQSQSDEWTSLELKVQNMCGGSCPSSG